jgi:hypothetical protein
MPQASLQHPSLFRVISVSNDCRNSGGVLRFPVGKSGAVRNAQRPRRTKSNMARCLLELGPALFLLNSAGRDLQTRDETKARTAMRNRRLLGVAAFAAAGICQVATATDAAANILFTVNVRYEAPPPFTTTASCLFMTLGVPFGSQTFAPRINGGQFCRPTSPASCFPQSTWLNFSTTPDVVAPATDTDLLWQTLNPATTITSGSGNDVGLTEPVTTPYTVRTIRWQTLDGSGNCVDIPSSVAHGWFVNMAVQFQNFQTPPAAAPPLVAVSPLQLNPSGPTLLPANGTLSQALAVHVAPGSMVVVRYDTLDPDLTDGTVSTTTFLETDVAPAGASSVATLTFTNNFDSGGGVVRPLSINNVNYAIVATQIPLTGLTLANTSLPMAPVAGVPLVPNVPAMGGVALWAAAGLLLVAGLVLVRRARAVRPRASA